MATEPSDLYPVIAQIAAAFAGFGSLAGGIGRRRADNARLDAYRLQLMLEASLSAILFGLVPALLSGLLGSESSGLRTSALAAAIAILIYAPLAAVRSRSVRTLAGFSSPAALINILCMWTSFAAFLLCVLDVPRLRGSSLYLLGLIGLLGSTITLFSRVIASMLRPHR